jgi:hypothetical protein
MSCRDVQRVVADYCLFGEQDGLTAPHLEHLSDCRSCRDEAGIDRALVRELRRALAARVGEGAPSAGVWQAVLRRTQEEPSAGGWRRWLGLGQRGPAGATPFVARLRTASALTTVALAVLMANGQNSMPVLPAAPAPTPSETWNQFERKAVVASRIDISLVKPIVDRAPPPPPPDAEEKIARSPVPSRPFLHVSRDQGRAPVEDEEAAAEDQGSAPRVIWSLYPPALDPALDSEPPAVGGDEPPAVRSLPGEPT